MPQIKALNALMNEYKPTWYGIGPLWYWQPPAIDKEVRVPTLTWKNTRLFNRTPEQDRITLDVNGAYLAFLSGVKLSLSGLEHTGPLHNPNVLIPGYYLVDVYRWQDTRIVSPLGSGPVGRRVWVTAPTLELLHQLYLQEEWPEIEVHDSWTTQIERNDRPGVARLTAWAAWLKELRADAYHSGDPQYREDVKDAYGAAINMFLGGEEGKDRKSKVRRPDWNKTIRAQHAANTWRKAWNSLRYGVDILNMGGTDTLTYSRADFEHLVELDYTIDKPPLKFDLAGLELGKFKIKEDAPKPTAVAE